MAQPTYYIDGLLQKPDAAAARSYLGITGGGAVRFSAGAVSSLRTDITFSNANGVSFGLDNAGIMTASVAPGATASNKYSAGTLAAFRTDLTFANSNGVSFGLDAAGVITATVATNYQSPGAYLTTGMASNRGSDFVQATAAFFGTNATGTIASNGISVSVAAPATGFTTVTTVGTNLVGTLSTNGLSLGVPAWLTTAALSQDSSKYAGTGLTTASTTGSDLVGTNGTNGLSLGVPAWLTAATAAAASIKLSAGTLSSNRTDLTFADSNGISFGLNTNGVLTATVATNYAGQGFTSASTAGSNIVATLSTNGLSMGVPNYLTSALTAFPRLDQVLDPNVDKVFNMGTDQVQFQYAGGGTFSTNATRQGLFELDFLGNAGSGAHGLYVLQSVGNQVDLHLVHIEGHDSNVLPFHIEGAHADGMWVNAPIRFTTDDTGVTLGSVPFIMGTQMSNSVANLNADLIDNREGSALAGTGTSATNISVTLNSNGIALSVDAGTATPTLATYHNLSWFSNFAFAANVSNTSYVFPLELPVRMTGSVFRFMGNWSFTSVAVQSTAVNNATGTTTSFNMTQAWNIGLYSMIPGSSQTALGLMTSTSVGATWLVSMSFASTTNAVNNTVSQTIIFPGKYGSMFTSNTNIASTSQSALVHTSVWTDFTALHFLDIPMSANLTPGNYWVLINNVSGTSGGRNINWAMTTVNQNQANSSINDMGVAQNASMGGWMSFMGSYTSAATTQFSTLTIDNHYTKGSVMPYMAILNAL